jgi:hypothetical protein
LTYSEILRIYDLPLVLDSILLNKQWQLERGAAPFEFALPPTIWAHVIRAIWGNEGGVHVTTAFPDTLFSDDADNVLNASGNLSPINVPRDSPAGGPRLSPIEAPRDLYCEWSH